MTKLTRNGNVLTAEFSEVIAESEVSADDIFITPSVQFAFAASGSKITITLAEPPSASLTLTIDDVVNLFNNAMADPFTHSFAPADSGILFEGNATSTAPVVLAESSIGNPFLFHGREFDPETGLYHYRARAYDPALARFLQQDPTGYSDGSNLYSGFLNNPANYTDPSGLYSISNFSQDIQDTAASVAGYGVGIVLSVSEALAAPTELAFTSAAEGYYDARAFTSAYETYGFDGVAAQEKIYRWEQRQKAIERIKALPFVNTFVEGSQIKSAYEMGNFSGGLQIGRTAFSTASDALIAYSAIRSYQNRTPIGAIRPASKQPVGGKGIVLRDAEGATPAEVRASTLGPTAGSRVGVQQVRKRLLRQWKKENPGQPYTCWRCGQQSTNPKDIHVGHRNVPVSKGGNLEPVNVCLEGAACNLSTGNRGLRLQVCHVRKGVLVVRRINDNKY